MVVAVEPTRAREFEALMAESAIPWQWIGTTGGERLRITVGAAKVWSWTESAWNRSRSWTHFMVIT